MSFRSLALFVGVSLLALRIALALSGCAALREAHDVAQPVADVTCTVLEVVTADQTVHDVCATEKEVDRIVTMIRTARADGGPRFASSRCRIVPTTTLCAEPAELARAIDAVKDSRRKRP